jgi:hypothetical protein
MKQIKTFGCLHPTYSFDEQVSVSTDSLSFDQNSKYKVLVQLEPPDILNLVPRILVAHKNFDLILAWSEEILNKCPNAKKFIFGSCWIDMSTFKADKKNEISFITSNKRLAIGHTLRHEVYSFLKTYTNSDFSINSVMTPPRLENKHPIFENAKFSIIIENANHRNWITEKLIDAFATKTIPIYCGCPNVGDYFNTDGILTFNNEGELVNILNSLTPELYDELSDVVNENYEKSFEYHDFHERVQQEIKNFISTVDN